MATLNTFIAILNAVWDFIHQFDALKDKKNPKRVFLNGDELPRAAVDVDVDWKLRGIIVETLRFSHGGNDYNITARRTIFGDSTVTVNGAPAADGDLDLKMDNLERTWWMTYRVEWREGGQAQVVQLFSDLTYTDLVPFAEALEDLAE